MMQQHYSAAIEAAKLLLQNPVLAFFIVLFSHLANVLLVQTLVRCYNDSKRIQSCSNTTISQSQYHNPQVQPLTSQAEALRQQTRMLKLEAARHTTPDTFVFKAKAERRLVVVEKQLATQSAREDAARKHPAFAASQAIRITLAVLFVAANWQRPVVLFEDERVVVPLQRVLASPHGVRVLGAGGVVAAGPWIVLCQRFANAVLPVGGS